MRANLTRGGLAFVIAAATATAALAQTPQRTTATYADWTLRCEIKADKTRACEMVQAISIQGQPRPIAQIAIGQNPDGAFKLVAQLPLSVWLPKDVTVAAGDTTLATAELKRCFPQFCLADTDITESTLKDMVGRTDIGSVSFQDAAQRDVKVPLSFKGLGEAYKALTEEQAQ